MDTEFNNNFRLARANWINKRLSELPNVKTGSHRGEPVVRIYINSRSGKPSHQTYYSTCDDYNHLFDLAQERQRLKEELRSLPQDQVKVTPYGRIKMTDDKWKTIPSSANPKEIKSDYYYKDIHMRSRFEVLTASVIDSLGLQFKYEPAISVRNETIYPDFLVYLPELGMCIIIECLGMLDDPKYVSNNSIKIQDYFASGIEMNRDIIYLSGNNQYLTNPAAIKDLIVIIINFLANRSVSHSSSCTSKQV